MGGGGSRPPKPKPEPDLEASQAAERERRRQRLMRGRASTVLSPTSGPAAPQANLGSVALTGGTR